MNFNLHHGAKHAGLDALDAFRAESIAKISDEWFGVFRTRRLHIRRAALSLRVGIQGELRDHEYASASIQYRAVHLSLLVVEDSQDGNLARKDFSVCLSVCMGHANQRDISIINRTYNLPVDGDTAACHTL
jgi:hypothetical protein